MGRTILCPHCQSALNEDILKQRNSENVCLVCGGSLLGDDGDKENTVQDDGLMYFDIIDIFENEPEYSNVNAYCKECGYNNSPSLALFEKLEDKKYVILKPDVVLNCEGCGKEHKPRKILYKRKEHYAPPLPHCPVCNSVMLKKITTGSKFLAAATVGMFALPYNSKTFECKDCGYRF